MLKLFIIQLLFLLLFSFMALNSEGLDSLLYKSCSTPTNFTTSSTFQSNLDQFLTSIPEKTVQHDWFFNDTVGKSPHQAYGLGMCYYDRAQDSSNNSDTCRACLEQAASNITSYCSYSLSAALLYPECLIRYSNENFFSVARVSRKSAYIVGSSGTGYASDHDNFMQVVIELANRLITEVADSTKLLVVGEASYTPSINIYGLVQCTRDLSANDCQKCLRVETGWIPDTSGCHASAGCNMYTLSCYMRYEGSFTAPFYKSIPPSSTPMLPSTPLTPSKPLTPPSVNHPLKYYAKTIVIAVVCSVAFLLMITAFLLCVRRQRRAIGSTVNSLGPNFRQGTDLISFDLNTLREATGGFSDMNKLGEGGFGQVFKGKLQNGIELAVKRLSTNSVQGVAELKNEVDLLGRLKHRNLVQVLGCCIQGGEKLLCYEYLSHGSLDMILFAKEFRRRKELDWMKRFNIIDGICRGIVYLHVESGATIIHRDLKASNILLDENMNPKISDFGLARLFPGNQTHKTTDILAGTFGYIAPEYALRLMFSAKSDVFSFGVLILEIITGRNCSSNLIGYVWQHWIRNEVMHLKDEALPAQCINQIAKCIHVGLLCVQENPEHRPSMSEVNIMLHSHISTLPTLPPGNLIWGAEMAYGSYNSTSSE